VMLQQTQVSVVVPYFERWMNLFPSIEALAKAPLEVVIKAWEGLGYYSRARRLHEAACYLMDNNQGRLPEDPKELEKIKGLGPYTIGAIRSFAYRAKTAAVDGNVLRVLSRYFSIEEDICKIKTIKKIWDLANELLPEEEHWLVNEALIELGATICSKKPKCKICPIRSSCSAYAKGLADTLPIKSAKIRIEKLYRSVAIIEAEDRSLLVKKEEGNKVMSGLLEFPYFSTTAEQGSENLQVFLKKEFSIDARFLQELPSVDHSFTRYRVSLFPRHFFSEKKDIEGFEWFSKEKLDSLAFSSGHRRLYLAWKNMAFRH